LLLAGGALAAYPAAVGVARFGPKASLPRLVVPDPQQPFPSGGLGPANAHPTVVTSRDAVQPVGTRLAAPLEPPPARGPA
jgi:hypothetical protein